MTDNKEMESKSDVKVKRFFSRIFMLTIMVTILVVWLLVGLKVIKDVNYAIYVSIAAAGAFLVISIAKAINQKGFSMGSPNSGKPYEAEDFGVLAMASPEDAENADKITEEGEPEDKPENNVI